MSKYKLSIIIPTFNAEKYIKRCINSLINQNFNFEDIEIILVDDNSTDMTKDIINEYSLKYKNIKTIFNETNSGSPSKPRNIGIENATSEYIMFMDNDDCFQPDMCSKMYDTITKENVDIVTCRAIVKTNTGELTPPRTFLDNEKDFVKVNSINEYPKLMSSGVPMLIWNKIFSKKLLLNYNIRFPEKDLYEDVYFMIPAYLNANGIIALNDFWGYEYIIRTSGEDKSTSQDYTEENLIKQLNGLKKIVNLLNKLEADYPVLECEMLIGWTKLLILTNPSNKKKKELLNESKELYKNYKLNVKLVNVSYPLNILINIFMKIFSLNIKLSIFIINFINLFRK